MTLCHKIEKCRNPITCVGKLNNWMFLVARKTHLQVSTRVFQTTAMREHTITQELFEEHHHQLIKIIAKLYAKIRKRHEARKMNEKEVYIPQRNTKLTHFAHQ